MLKRFLKSLESPKNPLLGPNIKGLKIMGLLQPEFGLKKHMANFVHFLAILFVVSQYVELWHIRSDLDKASRNLSITMLSTICVIKACSFIFWEKDWKLVINIVSKLELQQISIKDHKTASIMKKYIKYSRTITFLYWTIVAATVLTVNLAPLTRYASNAEYRQLIGENKEPYPEIISAWFPYKSTLPGYCIYVLENVIITLYGGGIAATYDSMAVSMMIFFAGQLSLLEMNCGRIFKEDNGPLNNKELNERIRNCHDHHVYLVKYSTILNSLLSPVLFIYIIVCSLMICSSVIMLTVPGTTGFQQISILEYVTAMIAQLFLYCWHSNEVLFKSREVDDGVYASAWWTQNSRVRRNIILLGGQLRKEIVFRAGPFTDLSVPAFFTILKASYSYFTLLRQSSNKN